MANFNINLWKFPELADWLYWLHTAEFVSLPNSCFQAARASPLCYLTRYAEEMNWQTIGSLFDVALPKINYGICLCLCHFNFKWFIVVLLYYVTCIYVQFRGYSCLKCTERIRWHKGQATCWSNCLVRYNLKFIKLLSIN